MVSIAIEYLLIDQIEPPIMTQRYGQIPRSLSLHQLKFSFELNTVPSIGKPVIAGAHLGTQVSQVLDSIGILIQPENPAALAKSLIKLYENPSERLWLGNLGRACACQDLDKEIILSRLHSSLVYSTGGLELIPAI